MQKTSNRPTNRNSNVSHSVKNGLFYFATWLFILLVGIWAVSAAHANDNISLSVDKPLALSETDFFNKVATIAEALAKQDYMDQTSSLPKELQDISYQQYRLIRFNPEHALWHKQSDYELQFFHPGFLYRKPVQLVEINANQSATLIPFEPSWFNYDGEAKPLHKLATNNHGYAGFRVHYPLNTSEYKDEVAVFLGASYFRLIGAGQNYGLSARGLAINTAETSGEEFPYFKQFWFQQPKVGEPLILYALLDSPSLSGAYRFVLMPGNDTKMQVNAQIFARKTVKKLGVAPLTSMFLFGENSKHNHDDFRPEVHDSDGLLMQTSQNEWIWRPLTNPAQLQVTSLSDTNPQGFGLLQRDTNFDHYLDAEANYHNRPGVWVKPLGDWGAGRIELVEIPTDSETNDNIVSYWVADKSLLKGESQRFNYLLSTVNGSPPIDKQSQVIRSRQGAIDIPGVKLTDKKAQRRFVIDFDSSGMNDLDSNNLPEVDIQLINGVAKDLRVLPILNGKIWRVTFVLTEYTKPVDMRLFMKKDSKRLSEVWNYVWKNNGDS